MKTRILKSAAVLMLVCVLAFSLTGCDKLDYREAIDLYNAGKYDAAAELFYQLGDYENSAELLTRSQYWSAITLMEQGNFQEALPRFLKLGDFEDSAQRVTECKYLLAIADFEADALADAEIGFLEIADYKQAPEYLRRITWQKLFDAVASAGAESGGSFTIQKEQDGKLFSVTADMAEPNQLILFVSNSKDMGYSFYDDLTLILTRDSLEATFSANSTFTMDYVDGQIGSEQKASGKVDISTCTAETVLKVDTFQMTSTDNLGATTTSDDPNHILMAEDMAENLTDLLTVIPALLTDSGVELTLQDIGFAAK